MIEDYCVIDLEMSGLKVKEDKILEVGAVRVRKGQVVETFGSLVNTGEPVPEFITKLTGITSEEVSKAPKADEVLGKFFEFIGDDVLVGQNVIFDYSFLKQWAVNHKKSFERNAIDTLKVARKFLPEEEKKDLESLCAYFEIERNNAHRALDDALETQKLLDIMYDRFGEENQDAFKPYPLNFKVKKQAPATKHQLERLKELMDYHGIKPEKDLKKLTRSEASRLTDKILAEYGRIN